MERAGSAKVCCLMCGDDAGDGIRILGQALCPACERWFTGLAVDDPDYQRVVVRIRDRLVRPAGLLAEWLCPEAIGISYPNR